MVSITFKTGITALWPERSSSKTLAAKALLARALAASWIKTLSTLGDRAFRATLIESLLNTPPVITSALWPTIALNCSSYPSGAVMMISSTTLESDINARSNNVMP